MPPDDESERPYLRIAAALRERITTGGLRPGDRVPSTRQVVRDFGVAMATASRALAVLRDEGLVVTRPGSGTVVRTPDPPPPRRARVPDRALSTERIVAAGITIADADGLDAVSMRRLAAALGVGPMSLYRHLSGREELDHLLLRAVFRAYPLPDPGPPGWRAKLELVCRTQWQAYRTHPWLTGLVSLTRPMLAPEAMAHTEWTLRALDGLPLSPAEKTREALALPALVRGLAISATAEKAAERETGLGNAQWWNTLNEEVHAVLRSGRFPRLAALHVESVQDFDGMLGHAVTRHLDGLAARLARA